VEYLDPALAGQSHVEHDQVVRFGARAALALLAIRGEVDEPSVLLEAALHVLADGRIVLDHEDAHARYSSPPGRRKLYSRIFR
jgi:hypothetical protein